MSNPAFAFDHIHIMSQSPKDSANWYVQMFGADKEGVGGRLLCYVSAPDGVSIELMEGRRPRM